MSEIIGISDHLGGFLLRRGCPGEKAWFLPRSTPTVGSLTRFVPQPQTPPGLTTSPQASLPACPAVGLSTSKILSDGSGDIEPPRRRAILPRPEGQGLTRHLVSPYRRRKACYRRDRESKRSTLSGHGRLARPRRCRRVPEPSRERRLLRPAYRSGMQTWTRCRPTPPSGHRGRARRS